MVDGQRGKDFEINEKSRMSASPDPEEDLGKHKQIYGLNRFYLHLVDEEDELEQMGNDEEKSQWKISIEKIKEDYQAFESKSKYSNDKVSFASI